jgi:hypothetical protein
MGRDAKRWWRSPTDTWTLILGSRFSTASLTDGGGHGCWSRSLVSEQN